MLLERRIYQFLPGRMQDFIDAQGERGFEVMRPIMERLLGYFTVPGEATEQVVHLYLYRDFSDWQTRLHGLYHIQSLLPYFAKVRSMMTCQENGFYQPLQPFDADTSWDKPPPLTSMLYEREILLRPGTVPQYWAKYRDLHSGGEIHGELIGAYSGISGRLSRVIEYSIEQTSDFESDAGDQSAGLHSFKNTVAPWICEEKTRLLQPVNVPEMSPLFL